VIQPRRIELRKPMAALLTGLRPSLFELQFWFTRLCAVVLWFASQRNGHRKVSLDKDSIIKIERERASSHVSFAAGEQSSRFAG